MMVSSTENTTTTATEPSPKPKSSPTKKKKTVSTTATAPPPPPPSTTKKKKKKKSKAGNIKKDDSSNEDENDLTKNESRHMKDGKKTPPSSQRDLEGEGGGDDHDNVDDHHHHHSPSTSLSMPFSPTSPSTRPSLSGSGSRSGGRGRGRGSSDQSGRGSSDQSGRGPGRGRGRGPGRGRGRGGPGRRYTGRGRGGRGRGPTHGLGGQQRMAAAGNAASQWMHQVGKVMMAPVPSNWTTASGHFKPKESDMGFDANSAVGANGARLSKTDRPATLGLSGSLHSAGTGSSTDEDPASNTVDIQVEIEDPAEREAFYKGLDEMGIKATMLIDDDYSERNPISVISLGHASYILDLAQQREMRENDRQEEALEEALDLYKTALSEGAKDDEKLFLAILNEVKKELGEKYVEQYKLKDQWLDDALQAELNRRENLAKEQNEAYQAEETSQNDTMLDDGKRASRVDEIIEWEGWDGYDENENWDDYIDCYDDDPDPAEGWDEPNMDDLTDTNQLSESVKPSEPPSKKTKGSGGCCGKAVEDSVVVTDGPRPDTSPRESSQKGSSALFKRLKKKRAEEEKKQRDVELLAEEDMWWNNDPVEVNVPEIEDDVPVPSFHSRASSLLSLGRRNSRHGSQKSSVVSGGEGEDVSNSERGSRRSSSIVSQSEETSHSGRASRTSSVLSQRDGRSHGGFSGSGAAITDSKMSLDPSTNTSPSVESGPEEGRKPKKKDKSKKKKKTKNKTPKDNGVGKTPDEVLKPTPKKKKKSSVKRNARLMDDGNDQPSKA